MSTTLYITAEKPTAHIDGLADDRVFVAGFMNQLDKLAAQLGVRPLSKFMSYDPQDLAAAFGDDAAEGAPPMEYFDAADAAKTARALIANLQQNPPTFAVMRGQDRSAELMHDLENCAKVFESAKSQMWRSDAGSRNEQ